MNVPFFKIFFSLNINNQQCKWTKFQTTQLSIHSTIQRKASQRYHTFTTNISKSEPNYKTMHVRNSNESPSFMTEEVSKAEINSHYGTLHNFGNIPIWDDWLHPELVRGVAWNILWLMTGRRWWMLKSVDKFQEINWRWCEGLFATDHSCSIVLLFLFFLCKKKRKIQTLVRLSM